ncbi:MAG: tRNA lysidine(34) synthetase TilS [Candidatus Cryptobacteroides sp.]
MQKRFDGILKSILGPLFEEDRETCFLLAVSGGVDSITMAELFAHSSIAPRFALAHCNFCLRGGESDADADFVASWASEHGVLLHTSSFDTEDFASTNSVSIEMAARELRYRWFASLCNEYGYSAVAVAHNANDNAETLILNLLRGTGIKGLSGMKEIAYVPYGGDVALVRPLLTFTRDQIEGFARACGIHWREDHTNSETEYKRNKIRNLVFPVFESINPSFIRTINRDIRLYASILNIADDYFNSLGDFKTAEREGETRFSIDRILAANHEYVLYRLLEPFGFNPSVISSIDRLLCSGKTISGKTFLSLSHRLITSSSELVVIPLSSDKSIEDEEIAICSDGEYSFGGTRIVVSTVDMAEDFPLQQPQGRIALDADKVAFPIFLRHWRPGDWFRPLGMKGRKKLSDWFTDKKYNIAAKDASIILASLDGDSDSSHILAVLGERIDDSVRITDGTVKILLISRL